MTNETFGPYRLESLIGRGGMGEVFRAHDTVRNRTVALKRLPASLAGDTGFQERFRREAQLVARLRDGHVIPIHDFGEIDGQLFIDMRLVDGADLRTVLDWIGPMPPERAVRIAGQVARALDAAHADGLVHRDVKPSNILLSGATRDPGADVDDYAYLVDFGIVASAGDVAGGRLTATGAAIGTVEYMSPERFLNGTGDRRIDVYALGCVLHEMLTGARPFSGTGPQQMWAHVNTPPPRPSLLRPGLPAALDDVIAAALAKDPDDRIGTAGELAARARAAIAAAPEPRTAHPGYGGTVDFPAGSAVPPGGAPWPAARPAGPSHPAPPTALPPAAQPARAQQWSPPPAPTRGYEPAAQQETVHGPRPTAHLPGGGGTAHSPAGPPPRRRTRLLLVTAAVAVVAVAVAVGVALAMNRTPETPTDASAADTGTSEPAAVTAGGAIGELQSHMSQALIDTCVDGGFADGDGAPVLATASCSDWSFELYPSPEDAAETVRSNNGGLDELYDPCSTRPTSDTAHHQPFESNGRPGGLGCRGTDAEYVVEFAMEGIPIVAVRYASDSGTPDDEDYAVVVAEAFSLSAELS